MDGKPVGSLTREELSATENRDIPTVGRMSDAVEAVADEKQDLTTSLNFPLHSEQCRRGLELPLRFVGRLRATRPQTRGSDTGLCCRNRAGRPENPDPALAFGPWRWICRPR